MKKFYLKLFLIIIIFLGVNVESFSKEKTFVSAAPSITEILYALGAENQLLAVSTECNYPREALKKEKIGNSFFFNKEKLLKLAPDYFLTVDGAQYANFRLPKNTSINLITYNIGSVNSVYETILSIGKLTDKYNRAINLVKKINSDIENSKPVNKKRILYLIQTQPFITVGNKSFLSDIIRKSGQISVTDNLNEFYSTVSREYIVKSNPDIIIVSYISDEQLLKKLFPTKKIIYLSPEENDIINRPSTRINYAVKFFANL